MTRLLLEGRDRTENRQLVAAAAAAVAAVLCYLLPTSAWPSPWSQLIGVVELADLALLAAAAYLVAACVLMRSRSRVAWTVIAILAGVWLWGTPDAAARHGHLEPIGLLIAGVVAVMLVVVVDLLRAPVRDRR